MCVDVIEEQQVQRPLGYAAAILHTDSDSIQGLSVNLINDWSYPCVERLWSFGYQSSQLERLFNSIPDELNSYLERGYLALKTVFRMRSLLQSQIDQPAYRREDLTPDDLKRWEDDVENGFLQITYDPDTNKRTHVVMNARFAHLHGYHKEEMLARVANHDLEAQQSDIDWLTLWLDSFQVFRHTFSVRSIAEKQSLNPCGDLIDSCKFGEYDFLQPGRFLCAIHRGQS